MTGDSARDRFSLLRTVAALTLAALTLQFLLGMWLNLFAAFPTTSQSYVGVMGTMMNFIFSGGMPVLMVHMMAGFLLLLLSVFVLVASIRTENNRVAFLGFVGLGAIVLSGVSGLDFMFSGFQDNFYSYLMATGFILAFGSYSAELYLLR